jgi:hypothetical protein
LPTQFAPQSAEHAACVHNSASAQETYGHIRNPKTRDKRFARSDRSRFEAKNHRLEEAAIDSRRQFDEKSLGPANIQVGDAKSDAIGKAFAVERFTVAAFARWMFCACHRPSVRPLAAISKHEPNALYSNHSRNGIRACPIAGGKVSEPGNCLNLENV